MTPVETVSLQLAEGDYREAVRRTEELRQVRNELVAQALAEGWTHARISEATGLTRGRVGQLAQVDNKNAR